jgi:hypothetical protein
MAARKISYFQPRFLAPGRENAIDTLRLMAKCAKDGQAWLAKGQAFVKEMLAEKKASKRPKAQQSSEVSGSDEEQCSVMDDLKKL